MWQVGVDLRLGGVGADPEQAVLALQLDVELGWDEVGAQRRDADPEVHVEAVLDLSRGARGHLVAGQGHCLVS